MSWNSTHTAICTAGAITISAMHYAVNIETIIPIIAAIGTYAAVREVKRIKDGV